MGGGNAEERFYSGDGPILRSTNAVHPCILLVSQFPETLHMRFPIAMNSWRRQGGSREDVWGWFGRISICASAM